MLTFKVLLLFLSNFLFQLFLTTHFLPSVLSFNKIVLHSSGWSESHYEHQAIPKFRDLPDSVSGVLRLKVYVAIPGPGILLPAAAGRISLTWTLHG